MNIIYFLVLFKIDKNFHSGHKANKNIRYNNTNIKKGYSYE